jgi:hypothetical protein
VTLSYLSGSPTHDDDLASVSEPLRRVLETNPQAQLVVVGPVQLPEALMARESAGQVRRMASVAWKILPRLMVDQGIGINLAPLDLSRDFCHAKSEVKFLEAAALGILTIASPAKDSGRRFAVKTGKPAVLPPLTRRRGRRSLAFWCGESGSVWRAASAPISRRR